MATTTTRKRPYAAGTTVSISKTKEEISSELARLGAVQRMMPEDDERHLAAVVFGVRRADGLLVQYRITLPLADPKADRFYYTSRWQRRSASVALAAWQQDCAERWRALGAYIKAMRLAVEAGITTTEQVLSSYVVLPNGQTTHEYMAEALPEIYTTCEMPDTLPGLPAPHSTTSRLLPAPDESTEFRSDD